MVRKFLLSLVVLLFIGIYTEVEAVNDRATKHICDMMEHALGQGAGSAIVVILLIGSDQEVDERIQLY